MNRMRSGGCRHHWGDLRDDRCNRIVRSVSFNNNGVNRVEMCQDGCLCKGCLEGCECFGVIGAPGERGVLAGEANQGDDNVGEPTMNRQ